MNTVLIFNNKNFDGMVASLEQLGKRQRKPLLGRLLIIKPTYIHAEQIDEALKHVRRFFEQTEMVSVSVSSSKSTHFQNSTMFSLFILKRYTKHPGAWLVIDEPFEIKQDNPISLMESFYKFGNSCGTGRGIVANGKGRLPVGPVVLDMAVERIRKIIHPDANGWRERIRWQLGRMSWYQIPKDEYPFGTTEMNDARHVLTQEETVVVDSLKDSFANVAVPVVESVERVRTPEDLPQIDYDALSDEELRELYKSRSGRYPHPSTKRENLLRRLVTLDLR